MVFIDHASNFSKIIYIPTPIHIFQWMCFLEMIIFIIFWQDVDTIYLSHDSRELNLADFDHMDPRYGNNY